MKFKYEFPAVDEAGGVHMLQVYVTMIRLGRGEEAEGMRSIYTADNGKVNVLERGKYQVVGGQILTSDDPLAI